MSREVASKIVGTPLGRLAKRTRFTLELMNCGLEQMGTIANDQLGEHLMTRLAERHFVDVGSHIGAIAFAHHF